jgi:hypothetical protein
VSNFTTITTRLPLDAKAVKRVCNLHFDSALTMHHAMGQRTSMCVLPIGSQRSFGIGFCEHEATITDDDNARRERFAATFARWFEGTIVAPQAK